MPGNPVRLVTNLKDESLGLLLHQRATGIPKTIQERLLEVACVANVDPLACIGDSVETRRLKRVGADAFGCKRPRSDLLKWHSLNWMNAGSSGMHVERPTVGFSPVELRHGVIALRIEPHFNESETFGLTAFTIMNDRHSVNRPVPFEQRSNLRFSGLEGEVSNEDIFQRRILSTCDPKSGQDRMRAAVNRANAKMPKNYWALLL